MMVHVTWQRAIARSSLDVFFFTLDQHLISTYLSMD